jgi:hypothetical protein
MLPGGDNARMLQAARDSRFAGEALKGLIRQRSSGLFYGHAAVRSVIVCFPHCAERAKAAFVQLYKARRVEASLAEPFHDVCSPWKPPLKLLQ